ncbi:MULTISPECIES: class I SAM-dependent methyltransferase [unclassified Streptomyces]|uniref:class I SAM-dependent methyltransferase n=1 Tax=unclassified Streptomyces TaxID=2593676 RepID=UPI000DB9C8C8|nr:MULTISPECIES: class I SAM-dependent methyltransferase [unclassified Streptomyces]MYT73739.1 methyltransferase domain-containing protein [Streptomyces sp. SID8367]RAJ85280.1 methyltransferase family protein [Streptomyces sp. PsTaAH-137]
MRDLDSQVPYWDGVAASKTFTHPLHPPWLNELGGTGDESGRTAVLDYGCGYGRTLGELAGHGFRDLTGVDSSPGMIERARRLHLTMRFAVLDAPPELPFQDAAFDAVLLFAVLTCVPGDDAQRRLVGELRRVLRPGGVLYVSDLLFQDDERDRARYDRDADRYGRYGVFETSDGAVCRHHSREWLTTLLGAFDVVATRAVPVATMNGHRSTGVQILARAPGLSRRPRRRRARRTP